MKRKGRYIIDTVSEVLVSRDDLSAESEVEEGEELASVLLLVRGTSVLPPAPSALRANIGNHVHGNASKAAKTAHKLL